MRSNGEAFWLHTLVGVGLRGVLYLCLLGGLGGPVSAASVATAVQTEDSAVVWRWIGILGEPRSSCRPEELTGIWSARRLFSVDGRNRWPSLEPFCVYEYMGGGDVPLSEQYLVDGLDGAFDYTFPPAWVVPSSDASLKSISPDRLAVVAAGSLTNAFWAQLASLYDEEAGRASVAGPSGPPRVRWTLVDTSPTGVGASFERADHGRTLRLLAERLLCAQTPCLAEVRTRLALPFEGIDPSSRVDSYNVRDEQAGGYVGLIGELAEVIVEEVDAWEDEVLIANKRLILNLSVAWDRAFGGGNLSQSPDQMREDVQAVFRVFENVACDDRILAVAAAGNQADYHFGNSTSQPLLPAAWRERTIDCSGNAVPFVVAVGGVDANLMPLSNSIPLGIPEFVSYGDHAAVQDPDSPGQPAGVLSGTSVAAVVTSATMAGVAAFRQDLDAHQLAHEVYQAGASTALSFADFCPPSGLSPCPPTRAISFCSTLQSVCSPVVSQCPISSIACDPLVQGSPQLTAPLPQTLRQISVSSFFSDQTTCTATICPGGNWFKESGLAIHFPCPAWQLHGLARQPFTKPQPQSNICPTCVYLSGAGDLALEIELGSSSEAVTAASLQLICQGTSVGYQLLSSGDPPLLDAEDLRVTGLPVGCQLGTVSFAIEDNNQPVGTALEPVLITQ